MLYKMLDRLVGLTLKIRENISKLGSLHSIKHDLKTRVKKSSMQLLLDIFVVSNQVLISAHVSAVFGCGFPLFQHKKLHKLT